MLGRRSIKHKLIATTLMVSVAALVLAGSIFFAYELLSFRQPVARTLSTLSDVIAANTTAALAFENRDDARRVLSSLRVKKSVVAAALYDDAGALFAKYPDTVADDELPNPPEPDGYRFAPDQVTMFHPVVHEGRRLGSLYVKENLDAVNRRLALYASVTAGIILVCGLLALLLSARLQRHISQPIIALANTARRVSDQRDYSLRAATGADDELGQLTNSFNHMLGEIQKRDLALRANERELEQRVMQRTAELEAANAKRERLLLELHERELEARAANHAKSTFVATMSHEIRTPLIGVLGMVEVLGRSELNSEQRRQLNIVHQSAHSLLRIVGDVLDFSKIEAGKMEVTPATVSLRARMARTIGNFSAAAESKGLSLASDIDAALATAHVVDGSLLGQILANWVGNAIKFTERGSVTVRVRVAEQAAGTQTLVISVSDTGIGIAPEQLAKLFEPFTQADIGTTRRYGGTGLGLAITLRLAKLIGGTVEADSTPGRGTTMSLRITLPVGDPAAIEPDSVEGSSAAVLTRPLPTLEDARTEGSLVLLAEDHPVNRLVLRQMLNIIGFQVEVGEDGQQAFERFSAGRYGLVFTDLHMPKMDGFQLTAAIRAFERAQGRVRTPVIALTANVQRQEIEYCLAGGMDDFMSKPVTVQQLAGKLHQWLPALHWETQRGPLPPARAEATAEAPIDRSVLRNAIGGDAGKELEFLRDFCQTVADDLKHLAEAERRGHGAIAEAAHRIKGAAQMVGAQEVARLGEQLERLARESPAADVSGLTDALRRAVARVTAYVGELPRGRP